MNNQIKRAKTKFTLEFKQDAVKLITEKGYTHHQAADILSISLSAIEFKSASSQIIGNLKLIQVL
jgi:transposase